jgi:hypothetical protein
VNSGGQCLILADLKKRGLILARAPLFSASGRNGDSLGRLDRSWFPPV